VRFLKLKIQNFLSIQDVELDLDDQGLVLIVGENRDAPLAGSNGSGKSAILDALCWALWGNTVRGYRHDNVVNRFVGSDCKVSLTFEDNDITYEVVRTRKSTTGQKPNDLYLFVDGDSDQAAGMGLTQARINHIIGLEFETFQCMMPGAGGRAAELTDAKIKELLEKLLQLEVLGKAQDLAKKERDAAAKKRDEASSELRSLLSKLESLETHMDSLAQKQRSYTEDKCKQIDRLLSSISDEEAKLSTHSKHVPVPELETLAEHLDKKIQAIKVQKEEANKEFGSQLPELKTLLREHQRTHAEVTASLNLVKKQLGFFEDHSNCSACNQEIDEDHKITQITQLTIGREQGKLELAKIEGVILDIKQDIEDFREAHASRSSKLEVERQMLTNQRRDTQSAMYEAKLAAQRRESSEEKIASLRASIETKQEEESPYSDLMLDLSKQADEVTSKRCRIKKTYNALSEQWDRLEFWVHGFSVRGLRSYILKRVVPTLNKRAKYYSELLTEGEMHVEFVTEKQLKSSNRTKNEFSIQVRQDHGAEDYAGNSVGERARADLVIAFTLGDLASARANKRIPFRFLDEPFENVDAAGHEAILSLLRSQSEDHNTVFCITHNKEFQDMFSNKLKIAKENGISRLVDG